MSNNDTCMYCKKGVKPDKKPVMSENMDMIIQGGKIIITYNAYSCDSSFDETIKINFCPMCGRNLN